MAMAKAPNILIITTDQEQSFVDLPDSLHLPARERLRSRSVAFRNYHVNTTPCGPSRSVIYTGQHTQFTGMFTNPNVPPHIELPRDMPTLGSMFRELGYHTVYKGKWHLSNLNEGLDCHSQRPDETHDALEPWGFAEYTHDGDHHGITWEGFKHDGAIAGDAANWLLGKDGRRPDDQPWLMAVNFINPHDIMFFDATRAMGTSRIDPRLVSSMKPAPHSPIYGEDLGEALPASFSDDLSTKPAAHRDDQRMLTFMFGDLPRQDEQAWLNFRNYYFNCIRDVDRHIDCVMKALDDSGEADNTIVLFTSDHGEMAGAHGMRQKGPSMYRENIRVSLMISHPDIDQPAEVDNLGSAVDLAPTLLSLAGVSESDIYDRWPALKGVSLAPALQGEGTARDERGALYNYTTNLNWDPDFIKAFLGGRARGEFTDEETARLGQGLSLDNHGCFRGLHDGRYKFARYFKPSEHHMPQDWETLTGHNELELYDTSADPDEINNLANSPDAHGELITTLNEKLNALITAEIGVDDGSCYAADGTYQL